MALLRDRRVLRSFAGIQAVLAALGLFGIVLAAVSAPERSRPGTPRPAWCCSAWRNGQRCDSGDEGGQDRAPP